MQNKINLIVVTGPTACGKTAFAANLAHKTKSEIISADSRQVYKKMNIGTGKDYKDYIVADTEIPYHLIDIVEAGYKYNVFEYQRDFMRVFEQLSNRNILPIMCGGTGMYIDAVIRNYKLLPVAPNTKLRKELEKLSMEELTEMLKKYKKLHNKTDIDTKKRIIRALEIEIYYAEKPADDFELTEIKPLIIGLHIDRDNRRKKITKRLKERINAGMIEEVKVLLDSGLSAENLLYYGLEYKFVTQYIIGELSKDDMFNKLNIAIHQFAKRQMTWFRGMEKKGVKINWIEALLPMEQKIEIATKLMAKEI